MFVGVARIVLQIPGARSLKERRKVVKSFKDRVRARLPVSIAEVGDVERYQVATFGVAVISSDSSHASEMLSRVTGMAGSLGDAVLADVATEIVSFGRGGQGVRGGIAQALSGSQSWDEADSPWNDEDDEEHS